MTRPDPTPGAPGPARAGSGAVRAAAIQLNSAADRDANVAAADTLIRAACRDGARLVVLPEKWNRLGRPAAVAAAAEALDGPTGAWASAIAAELEIDLVAGSIVEDRGPGAGRANTSVLYGGDGTVRAVYRKLHLFDVEVDGVVYAESAHEVAGDRPVAATLTGGVGIGLSICYDLRFPELYRSYAGVEVLAVPAAFTLATTRDHWELLLRARAVENQAFVVAANQIGEYLPGHRSGGRSMIVDPWGVVLAVAPDRVGYAVADLDLGALATVRRRLPALEHRRDPAIFGPVGGRFA